MKIWAVVTNSKAHQEYHRRFEAAGHCLGAIPQRTGIDADQQLYYAYSAILPLLVAEVDHA